MNFEDLQVIWNSQNNEKMYAINEEALHTYIQGKGRSINHLLNLFEFVLIGANLFGAVLLILGALDKSIPSPQFILSVFYLAFAIYGLIRRLMRRNEEKPFAHTLLGELDKAIWQIDYLQRQSRNMILWYLCPLTLIIGGMSFFNPRLFRAFVLLLFIIPVAYIIQRWEFNKFHLPNKHNLEILREKLTTHENQ